MTPRSSTAARREPIAPGLLRRMTVRRVLDTLRATGPTTRADLARATGISAPTISKAIASLLDLGVVEETDPAASATAGRPARRLRLATRSARVVGVVLDAERIEVGAAGLDGRQITGTRTSAATPASYEALIRTTADLVAPHLDADAELLGIGLSSPGLTDRREQRVILSPNLPVTNGRRPAADLAAALGVPASLCQEAHALCLAERLVGAARDLDDFAVLDATAGLGTGIYHAGQLVQGARGLAGEFGHVTFEPDGLPCGCGNRGCLETLATDRALAARVSEELGETLGADEALEAISVDPARHARAIDATEQWLSIAIAGVVNVFDPAAVFVHVRWPHRVDGAFDRLVARARARLVNPEKDVCVIEPSRVSKLDGAVAVVLHSTILR